MTDLQDALDEVIVRGLEDWLMAASVVSVAIHTAGAETDDEVRDVSVALIRRLLEDGLVRAGDVTDSGFEPWDLPVDAAMERVEREWNALGALPNLGEVCWLDNTEEGERRARELLQNRRQDGAAPPADR